MASIDPTKIKTIKEISRKEIPFALARQPESSRLFIGGSDFKLLEIDPLAEKPEPQEIGGHESYVTGVGLAGGYVISGGYDGRLMWWNAQTREHVRTVEAHAKWIRSVRASADGTLIASVADDMVARLWDAQTGEKIHELRGHAEQTPHHYPSMLYACAFSPDSRQLATADRTGRVVVWDAESGKELTAVEAPEMYTWDPKQRRHSIGGPRSLAFSPDGKLLAVGGMGQVGNIDHLGGQARLEVFDWQSGERTHEFAVGSFKGLVERLAFHPGGDWLLGAGGDNGGFLIFFDLDKKKILHETKAPMHVHDFALSESCDTLFAVGHNRIVVWEMKE
ncbi:MAG: PQQ-binding-like beta-propeller repeat protein [Planctomycetes bacterium]|nr:PQQ-binding-like beta-propeller repeat protein [Planctomycetota bacterium]